MSSFVYICAKCGAEAHKPPCTASKDHNASLGTWRCSNGCRGKVTVKRMSPKKEDRNGN